MNKQRNNVEAERDVVVPQIPSSSYTLWSIKDPNAMRRTRDMEIMVTIRGKGCILTFVDYSSCIPTTRLGASTTWSKFRWDFILWYGHYYAQSSEPQTIGWSVEFVCQGIMSNDRIQIGSHSSHEAISENFKFRPPRRWHIMTSGVPLKHMRISEGLPSKSAQSRPFFHSLSFPACPQA